MKTQKRKSIFSYYRPYQALFWSDMFFAVLGAGIVLAIPLIVRYITNTVVYLPGKEPLHKILELGAVMMVMVLIEAFCNFYIAYFGHIMGAKMEHGHATMSCSAHYQKLSFTISMTTRKWDSCCPG